MRVAMVKIVCALGLLWGYGERLQGQSVSDGLKMAKMYEASGEWEKARAVYQHLFQKNPRQEEIAKAYVECCIQTQKEQEALSVVDQVLSFSSRPLEWVVLKARLLYRLGRKGEALREWDRILQLNSKNIDAYRSVAQAMIQEKCMDEAIEVYLKARAQLSRPEVFVTELAGLYELQQQYEKATEEWIRFLTSRGTGAMSLPFFRFPNTPEVRNAVLRAFRKAIRTASDPVPILQWMMQYSLSVNEFSSAWEAVKLLEERGSVKQKGTFFHQFGQVAFSYGLWDEAYRAFKEIEIRYPSYSELSAIFLGLAQVAEKKQSFQEAIGYYDKVLQREKNNALALQAMGEKARVFREKLGNPTQALAMFQVLLEKYPSSSYQTSWLFEAGQCALILGDFASAEAFFQTGYEKTKQSKDRPISFLFFLAKSLYYQGKFKQALDTLQALNRSWKEIQIYEDPYFNDALALRSFLQKYGESCQNLLSFYSRAEFFLEQKRFREALATLDSLQIQNPNHAFWGEIHYKRGEILFQLKMYSQSLSEFSQFLKKAPGHLKADQAMAYQGKIYEQLGEKALAIESYDRLLERFPNSPIAGEIRERMDRLMKGLEK